MPGQMRPKRMSLQEAADYIATPEKWNPEDDARLDPALETTETDPEPEPFYEDDESPEAVNAMAQLVKDAEAGDPEAVRSVRELLAELDDPRAAEMAARFSPAVHNPVDATAEAPRPFDAAAQDIEMLTGPEALLYTAEARHAATLRLIDDLMAAYTVVEDLQRLISLVRAQ